MHYSLPPGERNWERFREELKAVTAADRAEEGRRLDAGQKMVAFIHGSG
ncbi:MAG TPA: hypothetical protein VK689_01000 [Armatimonadota bacterium]|nr:hypothetical protein [Armatimonadota bacterium]